MIWTFDKLPIWFYYIGDDLNKIKLVLIECASSFPCVQGERTAVRNPLTQRSMGSAKTRNGKRIRTGTKCLYL